MATAYIWDVVLGKAYYDFKNKDKYIREHILYMLNKTSRMFVWNGLPETISARDLETQIQTVGYVIFKDVANDLYAFGTGTSLGGIPNAYYMPTRAIISNPYLKYYTGEGLEIDKECVVIPSDSMYRGLLPIFKKYGTLLAENEITLRRAIIDARVIDIINTPTNNMAKGADAFLKKIEDGDAAYLDGSEYMRDIKVFSTSTGTNHRITDIIETQQYLKASELNEIGLDANYNMKRESINTSEAQLNDDALIPFVEDMLNMRKIGAEKVNAMFGTNITVELSDAWRHRRETVVADDDIRAGDQTDENETGDPEPTDQETDDTEPSDQEENTDTEDEKKDGEDDENN